MSILKEYFFCFRQNAGISFFIRNTHDFLSKVADGVASGMEWTHGGI